MNELKEQIEFNAYVRMESFKIGGGGKIKKRVDIDLDTLMQLIETYTVKKELEARIDELELAIHAASDIYHHEYTIRVQMIESRIKQLKDQLSSQLKDME